MPKSVPTACAHHSDALLALSLPGEVSLPAPSARLRELAVGSIAARVVVVGARSSAIRAAGEDWAVC